MNRKKVPWMSVLASANRGTAPLARRSWRIGAVLAVITALGVAAFLAAGVDQRWKSAGLEELESAARSHPNDIRILRNLALRLEEQGRFQDAFDTFTRAAAADGGDETAWRGAARLTSRLYGDQGALDLLYVFLKGRPDNAPARLDLAEIYLRFRAYRRMWEEATVVLKHDPRNADALRLKGIAEINMNHLPEAELSLRQAMALAPDDWQVSFALAGALGGLHRGAEAEAAYRRAITLAPSEVMPHLTLAKLLLDEAKTPADLQKAREEAQRTVVLNVNAPGGYLLLGQIDVRLSRMADAKQELLLAQKQDPREPAVAYELARLYQRTGDKANAGSELAHFRGLNRYLSEKRLLIERLSTNTADVKARLKLARLAAANGDTVEASRQYKLLLAKGVYSDIARQELSQISPYYQIENRLK